MSLYRITELVVLESLRGMMWRPGQMEVVKRIEGFEYPLKIVVIVEGDVAKVVTAYPRKRARGR
jgi:hypothetical protein